MIGTGEVRLSKPAAPSLVNHLEYQIFHEVEAFASPEYEIPSAATKRSQKCKEG